MKHNLHVKQKIGKALGEYRRSRNMSLPLVARQSGMEWQNIDYIELGNKTSWSNYRRLLDFYDKEIKVELVDKKTG